MSRTSPDRRCNNRQLFRPASGSGCGRVPQVVCDVLEHRTLFSAAFPSVAEQYMLELVNQARANPQGEIALLANDSDWNGATPDLNEGLPAGTISAAAKQPLAFNPFLVDAAEKHTQWMLTNQLFQHDEGTPSAPITFTQRDTTAGYVYGPHLLAAENIAWEGTTETPGLFDFTQLNENLLFIDTDTPGRGHRVDIMNPAYSEIGIGVSTGTFDTFNAVMATQDFGSAENGSFLTGVVYNDGNNNASFDPNEGLGNVTITATRTSDNAVFTTTSWAAGGYSLPLAPGTYKVTATGGGIGSPVAQTVTIGAVNVEADFIEAVAPPTVVNVIPEDKAGNGIAAGSAAKGQRSMETQIAVNFNEPVTLAAGAFKLNLVNNYGSGTNNGAADTALAGILGTPANPSGDGVTWIIPILANGTNSYALKGTGGGISGASLNNGVYDLAVTAADVTSTATPALAMTADYTSAAWHRLFGDVDNARHAFNTEYSGFLGAFNSTTASNGATNYNADLDYDGDGRVFNTDYSAFLGGFGSTKVYTEPES